MRYPIFSRNGSDYLLQSEVQFCGSLEPIFRFFADAQNLEKITPPFLHFKVLSNRPLKMQRGLLIDYRLRLYGLPLTWQSEITAWEPPVRFVDEQRKGPYTRWIHEHTFKEYEGVVTAVDLVRYSVPGGALVHALFVKNSLGRIFSYRRDKLLEIFGSSDILAKRLLSEAIERARLSSGESIKQAGRNNSVTTGDAGVRRETPKLWAFRAFPLRNSAYSVVKKLYSSNQIITKRIMEPF